MGRADDGGTMDDEEARTKLTTDADASIAMPWAAQCDIGGNDRLLSFVSLLVR